MRSWIVTVGIIAVVVVIVALASGASSDPESRTTGDTAATTAASSPTRPTPTPIVATVPFRPTKHAPRAQGQLAVQSGGGSKLKLTITLSVPRRTYGVALWSGKKHWKGLYAGYRGQNTQVLKIRPKRLFSARALVVGQQIVRHRATRERIAGRLFRVRRQTVRQRHLLRLPTGRILNELLATAARR